MTTAQTTADPDTSGALVSPQRRNFVFLAIVLGMLLAALDQTIVATALPTIVADLGGAGHQSWVVTSYLLASTIITALVGRLGDLFGRKTIFQAAVTFFVAGSVLCGLSQSMAMLVGRPGAAGHRRRCHHGHGHRADRRGHSAAGSRPLSGRVGRGVRRDHGDRPAAGRLFHRPPDLAVGVLGQRAGLDRRLLRCGRGDPVAGHAREAGHRLRRHPVRRAGRDRSDPGHQLGWHHLSVEFADDHRCCSPPPRRRWASLSGSKAVRLGRNPRPSCRPGCSPTRCSRCAACCRSWSGSRCWAH